VVIFGDIYSTHGLSIRRSQKHAASHPNTAHALNRRINDDSSLPARECRDYRIYACRRSDFRIIRAILYPIADWLLSGVVIFGGGGRCVLVVAVCDLIILVALFLVILLLLLLLVRFGLLPTLFHDDRIHLST